MKVNHILAMTIGELSRRTDTSTRCLRHYEAEGLISASRRRNGYRAFDDATVGVVQQIRLLLDLGIPIKAIRAIAPCLPDRAETMRFCPAIRGALEAQRAVLAARARSLRVVLRKLDAVLGAS